MVTEEKKRRSHNLGIYLRKLRDQRKLSLMRVEELSTVFKDKINPSYLSKAETGKFIPALPKLLTLSKIYGVKIQNFIERLDLEEGAPIDLTDITYEELKQKGLQELRHGNFKKALSYFEASLDLSLLSRKEKTAESELSIAVMLRNLGKLELARLRIEDILLKYCEDKDISSRAYLELSSIYKNQCHFPLAFMTIKEAENLSHSLSDLELKAHIFHSKANILAELNKIDEAKKYFEKAKKIYDKSNNNFEKCKVILNEGHAFAKSSSIDKSIILFEESLTIAYKFEYKKIIAVILSNLGSCYYNKNKIRESLKCFRESNAISRKGDYFHILFRNHFYLMKISEKRKETVSAMHYRQILRSFLPKIEVSLPELEEFKSDLDQEINKGK